MPKRRKMRLISEVNFLFRPNNIFPRLSEWCPPIYIGVNPPNGLLAAYHHIPADAKYIYIQSTDIMPGRNDFDAQADFIYHELAHVFEYKFMNRGAHGDRSVNFPS